MRYLILISAIVLLLFAGVKYKLNKKYIAEEEVLKKNYEKTETEKWNDYYIDEYKLNQWKNNEIWELRQNARIKIDYYGGLFVNRLINHDRFFELSTVCEMEIESSVDSIEALYMTKYLALKMPSFETPEDLEMKIHNSGMYILLFYSSILLFLIFGAVIISK